MFWARKGLLKFMGMVIPKALAMPMATISKQQDNGEIFINIPVPPIEERIKSD